MIDNFRNRVVRLFRNYSLPRWLVFVIDICTVFVSFFVAYILRFNFVLDDFRKELAIPQALIVLGAYAFFMLIFKSYAGLIRQTTIKDTFNIFLTSTVSFLAVLLITFLCRYYSWPAVYNIPLSIILIHYIILTVILAFFRVFIKMFYEFASGNSHTGKTFLFMAQANWVFL